MTPVSVLVSITTAAQAHGLGLGISAVFAVGVVGGAAWGYPAGKASAAAVAASSEENPEEYEQLLRLAFDAPAEELLKCAPFVLFSLLRSYGRHDELWVGFDRLAEQLSIVPLDRTSTDLIYMSIDLLRYSRFDGAASRRHWMPVLQRRI